MDQSTKRLDLESPLSMVLNILERMANGNVFQRPSRQEAARLRLLIATHSHELASPVELKTQLQGLSPTLVEYLADMGQGRRRQVKSNQDIAGGDQMEALEQRETPGGELMRVTVDPAEASSFAVPEHLYMGLGYNLFLDMITRNSAVRAASSPLAAVVKQAATVFDLLPLLGSQEAVDKLISFALELEKGYPVEGYHCRLHAADVTARLTAILNLTGLGARSARLAALVAAALHDYEHPQVTNHFLIQQEAAMAKAFNDQAVAENHSLRAGLAVAELPEFDFTQHLRSAVPGGALFHNFRKTVIELVLGTEMSRHFDIMGRFNAMIAGNPGLTRDISGSAKWKAMNEDETVLTLQVALKLADMGHCALPWEQHQVWIRRLQKEMFAQGDAEKEAGRDVSPLMDRDHPGVNCPESQLGFFNVFVLPLLNAFVKVFPECSPLLDQAKKNYMHWEQKNDPGKQFCTESGQARRKAALARRGSSLVPGRRGSNCTISLGRNISSRSIERDYSGFRPLSP